jgi:hypothetical protein
MQKSISIIAIFFLFTSFAPPNWGFFAHKRINRLAVFTLPPDLIRFYKSNIEYVTDHAVDPDMRRYSVAVEGSRHFMDLDQYGKQPFPNLPRTWTDALVSYSDLFAVTNDNDTFLLINHLNINAFQDTFTIKNRKFAVDSCQVYVKKYKFKLSYYFQDREENGEIQIPLDSIGQFMQKSKIRYSNIREVFAKDQLSTHGVLPYNLLRVYKRLVKAFAAKDKGLILKYSADIGHYIGDAHVPLHTTSNYNGQKTDQVGIHGFWESRLPELFADETYDYFVGKAEAIEKPKEYFWSIVFKSNTLVDSVLLIEKSLSKTFPSDNIMCFEERNGVIVKTYCKDYSTAYHKRMEGMVEDRMRDAILSVGSVWMSAWYDAGQPSLDDVQFEPTAAELKAIEEENKKYQGGKIIGRPEEH